MKTKKPKSHAAAGGTLRTQLDELIKGLPVAESPQRRMSRRERCAIEGLRRYLCGMAGAKVEDVKDAHVARFVLRLDWGWTYRNDFIIGHQTLEEVQVWAMDVLAKK